MRFMPHDVSDFQILRKIKSRAVNGYTRRTNLCSLSQIRWCRFDDLVSPDRMETTKSTASLKAPKP